MDARLQRRIQRYGWDLAAADYETHWRASLAGAQAHLLSLAATRPGEHVLDVACGTGLVSFDAARAVGPAGKVLGIDLSGQMVASAALHAGERGLPNVQFMRMDAEALELADASFDVALCALGLMYMPEPELAVREMWRVLRPRGRMVLAVWGARARCGWASIFAIVDAEVSSEVCPLFFRLGNEDALTRLCAQAGFDVVAQRRVAVTMEYADAEEACGAAFVGGPVALAWSRFGAAAKSRVSARYLDTLCEWRVGNGYSVPGEFVVVAAVRP